ncbi:hypothetical protein NEF87_002715 [Candidatus Lokiarchaeum ossiferum]|uniref:Uncharacterized protein n=1 Tax=Candidatus Lokiarchaeum ossiferum TaxID=2951803 RepID=A0ABY6HSM9_9ARCH|nr:hypothetical protein NEF87_002715 [Candidatus Lokiarchaeum sp. B-35]
MVFGLISILVFAPILFFFLENNFSTISVENTVELEQIDSDILNLAENFKIFQEDNNESQIFYFEFQGVITVFYENLNNLTTLYLNFYYNETKSPIFRHLIFNNELNITINSYQINQYFFLKEKNVISLIFS